MADDLPSKAAVGAKEIDLAQISAFALGEARVEPAIREISKHGDAEILEPRVVKVLAALAQARGEVVSRDQLIDRCWGGRIVSDDAINSCISKLRTEP